MAMRTPLRDVHVIAGAIGQSAELGLEVTGTLVDEDEFVAVDRTRPEGSGLDSTAQRDAAVLVVEHHEGFARGIGLVGGREIGDDPVDPRMGAHRPELCRIVASVQMRGATGESVPPELIVLQVADISVHLPRRAP